MVAENENLWQAVLTFMEAAGHNDFLGFKKTITRSTALASDLGMAGSDAEDFMESFSKEFNIAPGDFNFEDYFEGEGFLSISNPFKKQRRMKPITLAMLEAAAADGIWNSARLDSLQAGRGTPENHD